MTYFWINMLLGIASFSYIAWWYTSQLWKLNQRVDKLERARAKSQDQKIPQEGTGLQVPYIAQQHNGSASGC